MIDAATEVLQQLIAFASVSTTSNAAISHHVAGRLRELGFELELQTFKDEGGIEKVNLIGRRDPLGPPSGRGLAYFSHTDVVPANDWTGPGGDPFNAVIQANRLYGRGSCDMKGSLAAMLTAACGIDQRDQTAPLWIVCTADEERHLQGARHMVEHSAEYRRIVQSDPVAIVGEPTRCRVTHAHKGIVVFKIHSRGRAAHSSTTDGINANVAMVPMLQTLLELDQRSRLDEQFRNVDFNPPTLTWNFGVSDHATAVNIIPERSTAWVMLRTMPGVDGATLVEIARERASELGLRFEQTGQCEPLMTPRDSLCVSEFCEMAQSVHGDGTPTTACYATDGAVMTELTRRIIIGPGDIAQAHTSDEFIELDQLRRGIELYEKAIRQFCF